MEDSRGSSSMMFALIAVQVVIYFMQRTQPGATDLLQLVPADVWSGRAPWQVLTYMWAHDPNGFLHIAFNVIVLASFGSALAASWEPWRFFTYFVGCGVGAGLVIAAWPWIAQLWGGVSPYRPTIGSSGAVYGVLLANSVLWPDRPVHLLIGGEVRAAWLIPIFFGLGLVFDNGSISHTGHLGGVLAGWLILWAWGMTPPFDPERIRRKIEWWKMRQRLRQARREQR